MTQRRLDSVWIAAFAALLLFLVLSCIARTNHFNYDFQAFYGAAAKFVHHDLSFYVLNRPDPSFSYIYGPSFPIALAPLGYLTEPQARSIWAVLNALAFPLAWYFSEKTLRVLRPRLVIPPLARILTLLMLADAVTLNAIQGNVNAILFAFMAAAIWCAVGGRWMSAGFLAGFATATKLTPGALIIAFFLTREWRSFASACGWTLFFLLGLPVLVYGPQETVTMIHAWLAVVGRHDFYPFFQFNNQSTYVVFTRLFASPGLARSAQIFLALLGLASAGYWALRRNDLMVYCHAFLFILTWAPVAWIQYYLILVLPFLAVNSWFFNRDLKGTALGLWILRFALVNLCVQAFIGTYAATFMADRGNHFWGLWLLMGVLALHEARRESPRVAGAPKEL